MAALMGGQPLNFLVYHEEDCLFIDTRFNIFPTLYLLAISTGSQKEEVRLYAGPHKRPLFAGRHAQQHGSKVAHR